MKPLAIPYLLHPACGSLECLGVVCNNVTRAFPSGNERIQFSLKLFDRHFQVHHSLGGTTEEQNVVIASFFFGDFVLKWTSEIYSACLERLTIFCPKARHFSYCCGTVGPSAEYFAYVALIDYLFHLGLQLWNPPISSYICHCVCNFQVHYPLVRIIFSPNSPPST